jgi:hypothetical protein
MLAEKHGIDPELGAEIIRGLLIGDSGPATITVVDGRRR